MGKKSIEERILEEGRFLLAELRKTEGWSSNAVDTPNSHPSSLVVRTARECGRELKTAGGSSLGPRSEWCPLEVGQLQVLCSLRYGSKTGYVVVVPLRCPCVVF